MARKRNATDEQGGLIEDIREVRRQIEAVRACFALETDEDLLDAAIYQHEALQARYRYLLRQARESNAVAGELPVEWENNERWIN
ncbi:MAG: YaaL family protein [Oscillospiraceae bacterium]|nr:YaaL family protein [Oscillospiraceae bacterium]MCL1952232.1 YaaL family protein [Oscillospiraceae bacterium]